MNFGSYPTCVWQRGLGITGFSQICSVEARLGKVLARFWRSIFWMESVWDLEKRSAFSDSVNTGRQDEGAWVALAPMYYAAWCWDSEQLNAARPLSLWAHLRDAIVCCSQDFTNLMHRLWSTRLLEVILASDVPCYSLQ